MSTTLKNGLMSRLSIIVQCLIAAAILITLYLISLHNYLLFHGIVELTSIVIAFSIFILVWNTRKVITNTFFLIVGISFLFTGSIDLIHTLAYKGMGVFAGNSSDLPTQLWIAARYFQSITFFIATLFIGKSITKDRNYDTGIILAAFATFSGLLLASIFIWQNFPSCFVEGTGLTPFKIFSEYIISCLLIATVVVLVIKRQSFETGVWQLLIAAQVFLLLGELAFTSYISVYGFMNMLGHLFRLISVYLFYRAFVVVGLTRPYELLFRELKKNETALRMLSGDLREIVDHAPAMIFYKDTKNNFLRINPAGARAFGKSIDDIEGKSAYALFPDFAEKYYQDDQEVINSGKPRFGIIEPMTTASGDNLWVQTDKIPLRDEHDTINGVLVFAVDITKRKHAEDALKESELRFRTMADWTSDWEYWIDPNRKFVFLSPSVEQITGYPPEEFIADPPLIDRIVHPDDQNVWDLHIPLHETTKETNPSEIEFRIIHKDGSVRWISHICRSIILEDCTCIGRRISNRDVTDRKLMESEIRSLNSALEQRVEQRTAQLALSLEDKIILLREVHHRVKNNLQIIISLLHLQSRYIEDEKTRQAINESQNRVRAMAMVHEKLYQSTDIATIDLDNYLRFLGKQLFQFYGVHGTGIILNIHIQDINLNINTAIPIGLIVNELVSNSLKHAFPDGKKGEISLAIQRENAIITILFKDNGVGIPQDFDWRNAESLGLRLVIMLVEQHDGTIELDRSSGTMFTIIVKEKE